MIVRNAWRALITLVLATTLAGCGAAGSVNVQTTSGTGGSAGTSGSGTEVVTRTVLVTSTVFATVTIGGSTASTPSVTSASASQTAAATPTVTGTSESLSTESTESTETAHKTPTPAAGSLPVAGAANVTLAFLAALEKDPSGKTSLQYLSTRLQGVVQSGHSIASIIGSQNMYSHYQAEAAVSRGGGRAATVQITLTYASGPAVRIVTLIPENGAWRIDDIAATSA